MRRLYRGVEISGGHIAVGRTHGGRLFMFTICCTKLKVAVIMACEAVSWLLVNMRVYGPTRKMNSQSQESQRRRRSLEKVSKRPRLLHIGTNQKRGPLCFPGIVW